MCLSLIRSDAISAIAQADHESSVERNPVVLAPGCQWRALPKDIRPRSTRTEVTSIAGATSGTWSLDRDDLIKIVSPRRTRRGEAILPQASSTCQSLKTSESGGPQWLCTTAKSSSRAQTLSHRLPIRIDRFDLTHASGTAANDSGHFSKAVALTFARNPSVARSRKLCAKVCADRRLVRSENALHEAIADGARSASNRRSLLDPAWPNLQSPNRGDGWREAQTCRCARAVSLITSLE